MRNNLNFENFCAIHKYGVSSYGINNENCIPYLRSPNKHENN